MTFSHETLKSTLETLTTDKAVKLIGLAGNTREFESLVLNLARNFNVQVQPSTMATIKEASKRFHAVKRHRLVSYQC